MMKIEIYSDVACPWCYIGDRRLERALAAFQHRDEVEVVYRPYQLDPGAPAEAIPLPRYLEGRFGAGAAAKMGQVVEAAASEGLTIRFEDALAVNTGDAHRLARLAEREHGPEVQRSLMQALFAAHFSDGRNVGDHETLAELAESAGMDGARVRGYLASEEGRAEVQAEIEAARRLGIQAVPTFVFDGRYGVSGAQPTSAFMQVLERVWDETAGAAAAGGDPGDADCADGSCAV
jgi:predicted DsbA family dithiol-disulfide isomerase